MAIGQGGYKGNLEEIMDALGPEPDQAFLDKPFLTGVADAGKDVYDYFSQTPEFLSNMGEFYREAWAPQFEGHQPLLGGPANITSVVAGPVDTALTLGSAFATGAVSGLDGHCKRILFR